MYTFPPIAAIIGIASTVVSALTDVLTPVFAASAAAVAVILLTVLVRALLIPLGVAQVRAEKRRARMAPRIRDIQRRHGKDPARLQTELAKAYREEGTSPLAGCLPMLAQAPVFMGVYGLFLSPSIGGEPNSLLTHTVADVALGDRLGDVLGSGPGMLVFAAVMGVLVVTAWATRRFVTTPSVAAPPADPTATGSDTGGSDTGGTNVPGLRLIAYLPYLTVVVAAFAPLAAGLYLATSTAWTVGEKVILRRVVTVPPPGR